MLDEDLDLKAKIADVVECAVKEVITLVEADREIEKELGRTIARMDDGGAARALLAARQCEWRTYHRGNNEVDKARGQ